MVKERPIIYKYHDHLSYIVDMFEYKKLNENGHSLKIISQKFGITPSYLSMVLSGKRDLTRMLTKMIDQYFSLSKNDSDFFHLLVDFNLESDDRLKSDCFEKMKKFKKYRTYNQENTNWHNYMSKWINVTIREMTAMKDFKDDPKWIQENLKYPVNLSDIKDALEFLLREEVIIKDSDGNFQKPDITISCIDKVYSNALAKFHRDFLQLAGDSITKTKTEERQLMGHCVAFDQENFVQAKEILNEALSKIRNLENKSDKIEAVYFVELALFPLTEK